MKNSIAIYCANITESKDIISKIRSSLNNYDDFFIFTDIFDSANGYDQYGIMSTFYMKFFRGKVIFLTKNDYDKYHTDILGECVLYVSVQ